MQSGLFDAVLHAARHKPLFGVCVGMQMLLDRSEEARHCRGLGLIRRVTWSKFQLQGRLQPDGSRFKVPQMGWNQVYHGQPLGRGALAPGVGGVPDGSLLSILSTAITPSPATHAQHSVGETDYGNRFSAAMARDNIFATQFHPEKSADQGLSCCTAISCTGIP
jgi:glutamine amidotransferase